jgi:hypothetical protein
VSSLSFCDRPGSAYLRLIVDDDDDDVDDDVDDDDDDDVTKIYKSSLRMSINTYIQIGTYTYSHAKILYGYHQHHPTVS